MDAKKLAITGVFGSLGAILRYLPFLLVSIVISIPSFYSTLMVNLIGSFLLSYFLNKQIKESKYSSFLSQYRSEVLGGLIGAFTTFSALIFEISLFNHSGSYLMSFLYIIFTLVFSFLAYSFGEKLTLLQNHQDKFSQSPQILLSETRKVD